MTTPDQIAPVEIVDDREAMHRERSRRYAEALAAAAAADERIKALTTDLEEAEYLRRIAEDEAGAASWLDSELNGADRHIYHAGDPEPGADVEFLFSLSDGVIFQAARWSEDRERHGWHRLDYESATASSYGDWPAALEAAPLIALTKNETSRGLYRLATLVNQHIADYTKFRQRLPRHSEEKNPWATPDLALRLDQLELRHAETTTKLRDDLQRAQSEGLRYFVERFAEAIREGNEAMMQGALAHWDEVAARS